MNILGGLNKYLQYAVYVLIVVSCISGCNSCSAKKETERLRKEVDSLNTQIDVLNDKLYTKDQLDTRLEILGYEVSQRLVYSENAIVRTAKRPDDIMDEYGKKIKELNEKIKQERVEVK